MAFLRNRFFLFCVLFAATTAFADDNLSGLYKGRIGDASAMLTLQVSGSGVTGRITQSSGNNIDLKGTFSEGKIVGAASTRRGASFFEAYREFGALVILIRESGAVTGQEVETRAEFFPTEETTGSDTSASALPQRDQELVGTWTARGLASRGDMVLPVTTEMTLGPDGRYSEISEPTSESKRGQWRSADKRLDYRPRDTDAWSPLGEYRLHGDKLITILPGDDPRVWTRRPD